MKNNIYINKPLEMCLNSGWLCSHRTHENSSLEKNSSLKSESLSLRSKLILSMAKSNDSIFLILLVIYQNISKVRECRL